MRVERGKDRAEAVGDKMERKRGRGRRGVGRNVSWFFSFWGGGLGWVGLGCVLLFCVGWLGDEWGWKGLRLTSVCE